ncbi:MAG: ribosomal protein S18-alanine N-acetyltransferase [Alphaproteobacteria bacterium]|nr:ribosomal protein S18-alanine N-acetyltransferase [Alphaproteobacteria bacterium]MBQ8368106.1 ribosomal protein S18-alanine N-acetyltransferase [Alphaproteobacteria bacterium]MBQ8729064.1 ribosomal protein S18-alanine N-acetyltransferase [Alphaproteobacteria bacterium]
MLEDLAKLHQTCFPHKPWGADDFADLQKSGCEIIASQNGFIVWRATLDEAEIITIGVHPDARRSGIAAAMLGIMAADLKKRGVKHIFLEVAADNVAARALYEQDGFVQIGVRPKYYDGIDAIMMRKDI